MSRLGAISALDRAILERRHAALLRPPLRSRIAPALAVAALAALAGHIEALDAADDQAPVRRCHRYLSGRRNHLNYRDALANDLPIGSGEIESAHRYIAQQRLKRPGAWWRVEHAEHMLALRINRRNGDWVAYWATFGKTGSSANQNRPAGSRKSAA